jgi:hypothetical protein
MSHGEVAEVASSTVNAYAGEGGPGPAGTVQNRLRFCPSCGRSIGWDVLTCPYCSWSQGAATNLVDTHDPIPGWKRVLLYVGSILIPLFGIVIGAIYLGRPDQEHRSAGTVCLVLGAVSVFLLPTVLAAILYVMVLGW